MTAARSTVDALMYSLRQGVGALQREDVLNRLGELDDKQIAEVVALLLARKLFPAWSENDATILANVWEKLS
jgi:hypothetical protein